MALKNLFGDSSKQIVVNKTLDDLHDEIKTENFLDVLDKQNQRYTPNIDFSDPANFARFGSAEKYYVDGIKNVYQRYPYDGSKKEKLEWRYNSTLIDLHIFDNIYPKSSGYINLSVSGNLGNSLGLRSSSVPQYVVVKGGPNVSSDGSFNASNIYDVNTNRESNLGITDLGNTLEFWFKDETSNSNINYNYGYALFDLWNNVTASNSNYARMTVTKVSGSNKFALTYRSGSSGITDQLLDYTFDSSTWHHYAFSIENINVNDLQVCLYVDGDLALKNVYAGSGNIKLANNANAIANIGCYRADSTGNSSYEGLGVSRGSYDDLRFWKVARSSQDIYRNWFTSVHGGSNIDDFGADLGLYLKFNEGLINPLTSSNLDAVCLDYSGRITNGNIVNYCIGTKITGSAIDSYYNEDGKEEKDPIIFSTNPLVQDAIETYTQIGFDYDINNPSSIYKSLPSWITEEAEKLQLNDLSHLIQIISSYFDTLYIQIEHLTKLKDVEYVSEGQKPRPFASNLLTSNNFDNLDLFSDASFLEKVLSRNENSNFEYSLNEIKNTIYQNIYNNLAHIYKSKGTEKSFRNLIRCFGVDDELIKINLYSDNSVYDLENKYTLTSNYKKFVDFNDPDRYDGFVYQKRKSTDTTNTRSYIKSSTDEAFKYIPITVQAEVIFPKYVPVPNVPFTVNFQSSSLFGAHSAKTDQDDYAWNTGDLFNFQVYSIRTALGSPDVKFLLTGSFSGSSINVTSSIYKDVYSNSKWNFAVRISQQNYDQTNVSSGSGNANYNVELIGINSVADTIDNQFIISASVPSTNMVQALAEHKRLYVGSHYEDFDNTKPLNLTDVKISSLRFWYDYLTNEELTDHSYDSLSYGRKYPNQTPSYILSLANKPSISSIETLVLNWDFSNVSSSNTSGQFIVEDVSSGSYLESKSYHLGWFGDYIKYQHPGLGDEFLPNETQVVNKEYVLSAKKQLPETINGNELIQIPDTDDVTKIKDSKAITYYLSIEKSMAQVISSEMLNWFATIKGFNNLLGNPSERYKKEYSGLNHLRELFFNQVGNTPNFEKFFEFYKWIDSSLSTVISQLIPLSSDASANIRNTIESHLFERSKYENKLPSIEFKGEAKSYPVGSIQNYSYTEQAAYPNNLTDNVKISRYYNFKPLWLKQRVKRTDDLVDSPLEPQNDIDREVIRQVINHNNLDKLPTLFTPSGTPYEGNNDKSKIFSKTYKLSADELYIFEDTISLGNISNTRIDSQFKFAADTITGSEQIIQPAKKRGNYSNTYEYLQLSSRATNNKSFVDLTGNIPSDSGSNILGFTDRTLPVRNAYKNIIVEKFSAPGSPEASSRGALDKNAEEYSVYNSLNYRNSRVRKNLNKWLAETSSFSEDAPSIHQNPDNIARYPGDDNNTYTNVQNDNAFISHAIPRSDYQYAWITASMQSGSTFSGYSSEFTNLNIDYAFISGNISGSSIVDFVGLNNTIVKTVDTSSNTISSSNVSDLNKYLSNLNGPYQHPSWKQIRGNESLVSRVSKKENKILIQDQPSAKTKLVNGVYVVEPENRSQTFTSYKEMPVTFNKPMLHKIDIEGSSDLVETISTYDNNIKMFGNDALNNTLGLDNKTMPQLHDVLKDLENGLYQPKPEIVFTKHEQHLFPSNTYIGSADVRMRENYEDWQGNTGSIINARTYWRNDIYERARESTTKDIYDYLYTNYDALPDEQPITVYNDIINNTNIITNIQENKTSILSQDRDENFTTIEEYKNFSYNNFNKFVKISSLGEIVSIKTEPYTINIYDPSNSYYQSAIFPAVTENIIYAPITISASSPSASYWDGFSWKPMSGSGLSFTIPNPGGYSGRYNKTFISGTNRIYASGRFSNFLSGANVSQWDGVSWSPMGGGLGSGLGDYGVHTLCSGANRVYAGGYFTDSYTTTISGSGVSQWDGTSWSPMGGGLGPGVGNIVYSLASGSNRVYAGGTFNIAASGSRVSQWDGTSWSPMAGGLPDGKLYYSLSGFNYIYYNTKGIFSIVSGTDKVYAAGNFYSVDSGSNISQWDGTSWSPMGSGLNGPAMSMVSNSSGLYVVGLFTTAGGKVCNGLARWDGQNWYSYSNASYTKPYTITSDVNNNLYINGNFTQVYSNNLFYKIAKYNSPSTMTAVGEGLRSTVYALTSGSGGIYAGGSMLNTDISVSGTSILVFDGSNWQAIGGGIGSGNTPEYVYAIASGSNRVYAGGDFSFNLSSGSYISQWNGTTWSNLGGFIPSGKILCLLSSSEGLYAGGQFTGLGGGYFISRWNGTVWNRVGSGTGITNQPYYSVFCLISGSNFIYTGGGGGSGGALGYDPSLGDISYFSGSTWQRLSIIPKGTVTSLFSSSEGLYAGGVFRFIGSETYNYIGLWNGFSWSKLGLGVRGPVNTIVSSSDGILVGGSFTNAGGQTANYIAKWDGSSWSNVATGFDAEVKTMLSTSAGIYIGGAFQTFGDVEAKNARYERNIKGNITANDLPENVYFIKNNINYYVDGLARYNIKEKNLYNINSNLDRLEILAPGEYIYDMTSSSSGLYAVGSFLSLETGSYDYIARRVGQTWQSIGNISNTVNTIISGSNRIYIGGDFTGSAGTSTRYVAQWNGTSWLSMSSGLTASVKTLCSGANKVYAGGTFNIAASGSRVSQWDGTNWSPMSTGLPGTVNKIISGSNAVFAAGNFTGGSTGTRVSQWNGTTWSQMAGGLNGEVFSILSGSNGVYAVGNFNSVASGSYISQWDGIAWSPVGGGFNNIARDLFSNSSGLYIVGDFTLGYNSLTPISLNGVAKWNGSSYEQVNNSNHRNGFDLSNGSPNKIIGDEDNLLIAGTFTRIKSGPIFTPKNYNNSVEAYVTENMLMPTPQLVHLNYIQPSYGFTEGMKITEVGYNSNNELVSTVAYAGKERINILNEGYVYEIPEKSGKTPFFNSYLDYLGSLKATTAKYSIVPEYTISDYIKTYVNDKNGNFNSILQQDYLKLDGAAQQSGYEDINNSINFTNTLKPQLIFDNSKNNENVSLNFKLSGIKKLIPYRDFYPSERIVKLSNYFMNSFLDLNIEFASELSPEQIYQSVLSNETPINQQILTLLQPIMAPGILLNTIKSSIALDWPAFIGNSGSYASLSKPSFYAETGSALVSSSYYASGTYVSYTASNYIDQEQNYRFPFESLIEFDTLIPQELKKDENNLYYLNPSYYTSDVLDTDEYNKFAYPSYNMGTGSLKPFAFRNSNYKLAMHNFLAEIPYFFLNGKLSNIASLPEKFFKAAKQGVTYYMDVVLERNDKLKEFVAVPFYEKLKLLVNSQNDGTLLLPSPDSLYGPPTRYWNNVNPSIFFNRSPYNFYSKLFDTPAYAPYVPPYYYGKAIARISFKAEDTRQYTLAEIQNSCSVEYINTEAEALFLQRSNFINGNFTGSFVDNYKSSPAYKQMMKLSSSVNLFLAADTKLTKQDASTGQTIDISDSQINNQSWVIQTKFETPSINFIDSDLSENIGLKFLGGTKESGSVKGIYSYMMKGLWTTYGQPVKDGEGIKLYIQESYPSNVSANTGSLINLCGFSNVLDQKKTIGLLAERKKVSECMVMMPYTFRKNHGIDTDSTYAATLPEILGENGIYETSQTGNGPYYYAINENLISQYLGGINFANASLEQIKAAAESSQYKDNSIVKLILAMIKFVVPPHLDWVRNKNIKPFVMYTAEFSTEFDKQDLSDIWQGVMPKQSYNAEIEDISISHKFTDGEFFHGKRPQNDTKFKIFKIKQRANINYYKLTDSSKDDERFKFTFGNSQQATIPEYSYNWPYDFFSLVELVNIEAGLEYNKSDNE